MSFFDLQRTYTVKLRSNDDTLNTSLLSRYHNILYIAQRYFDCYEYVRYVDRDKQSYYVYTLKREWDNPQLFTLLSGTVSMYSDLEDKINTLNESDY